MPWIPPFYSNNMKSRYTPIVFLCFLACVLTTCGTPDSSPAALAPAVQEDYSPPQFEDPDRLAKISAALTDAPERYREAARLFHLPGVAYGLVVEDSLVLSGGLGVVQLDTREAVTENSLFRIASMSKSFTAMAILQLRDEGRLSLEDPISDYLPYLAMLEYPTADAQPITVFNLLTMTGGFPEDNPWGDRFLDISPETLKEKVSEGIPFSTVPSQHYEYSNLGYGLLGQIISEVSGTSFQEYITENILEPLGMFNSYWEFEQAPQKDLALGYRWEQDSWIAEPMLHDGAFGAMGGLITSIKDFSKYVSLHLSAYPPRNDSDEGPLKRSSLREMHRMNLPRFYSRTSRFNSSDQIMRGYGYGLVAMKDQQGVIEVGHNGGLPGFGSSYMFYPEHGIGIMAFSNLTYVGGRVQHANYQVIQSLMDQHLFRSRKLAVSPILALRKDQVSQLLMHWDPELEKDIVAANLYLDRSRESRMQEARELLSRIGDIRSVGPVEAENQLRGSFVIFGSQGMAEVYFTLSPEANPRVQWISLEFIPPEE